LIDLNPVWDEIIYAPIHSLKETLLLEVMDYQHVTKDRSLGTIELKISELAQELPKGPGNPRISYESTGKMDKSERIRLDRENRYKGRLHYVAEFLPAFMLQGLKFETDRNELESAVEAYENGNDVAGDSESMSSEGEPVAGAGTTTEPIDSQNNSQCTGTTYAAASSGATVVSKTANAREGSPTSMEAHSANRTDAAKREDEGIYMSKDELLTHRRW
jgi:Ca2+-dependent lipid-binding protein